MLKINDKIKHGFSYSVIFKNVENGKKYNWSNAEALPYFYLRRVQSCGIIHNVNKK